MMGKTHIIFGCSASAVVANEFLNVELTPISLVPLVVITSFGALLPDIDHANSTLGHRVPIFSKIFRHRGFTHTVWFVILMYILYILLNEHFNIINPYVTYFFVGLISHLVGDILTPAGLEILRIPGIEKYSKFNISIPIIQHEKVEKLFQFSLYMIFPFLII